MPPILPTSNALSEASPDSLGELFSRAPPYPPADLNKIVMVLREQRERYNQAKASGAKAPRPAKLPTPVVPIDPSSSLVL